jgi:hypothetical protein
MFAVHCPACDRRALYGYDRVTSIRSEGGRHDVGLTCRCGAKVRWTSRAAATVTSLPGH